MRLLEDDDADNREEPLPNRFAAPYTARRPRRFLTGALIAAVLVLAAIYVVHDHRSHGNTTVASAPSPAPATTVSPATTNAAPARSILTADGTTLAPERLRGRWTMLFTPGEPCVATCARVLETLAAVARDPASGVQDGVAQIVLAHPDGKQAAEEIVVLDPEGRNAGLISHVTDAGRIVSGLATLRAAYVASNTTASR